MHWGISTSLMNSILILDLPCRNYSQKLYILVANDGSEATPSGCLTRHSEHCKWQNQLSEHHDHWWCIIGLSIQPRFKIQWSNGDIKHPQGQKLHDRCAATSKWCWHFSLHSIRLYITSTHYKNKTLTKNTFSRLTLVCLIPCGAK